MVDHLGYHSVAGMGSDIRAAQTVSNLAQFVVAECRYPCQVKRLLAEQPTPAVVTNNVGGVNATQ